MKRPPKSTIEQNILRFIQQHELVNLDDIAVYVDLQPALAEQLLTSMIKRDYISKDTTSKYYANYLYPDL